MAEPLVVKVEPFGADQRAHDRVTRGLVASGPLREHLGDADHRLLALRLLEPDRKTAKPRERDRFRATYYDYTANRAVQAEGRIGDMSAAAVSVSAQQPRSTAEEFDAAVKILRRHKELGPALRSGALQPYR